MAPHRDNSVKVSALLRAGHKVSEVANLVGVSRTTVYSIEKRMDDGEGVNRRASSGRKTVVDRDSLRNAIRSSSRTPMRHHARRLRVGSATVWRSVAKLRAKSRIIVGSRLLSAPSGLNVSRCSLMTWSLFRQEKWSSSQMRRLRRQILRETERMTATCLLGKRTRVSALCQKWNIYHPSCRSVSSHPMAQSCLWSGSRLGIDWMQGTTRPS